MTSILDHIVLDHVKEHTVQKLAIEKHLRRFYRTGRDSENYFSPVSAMHLDNYDSRFHRRGVFTAIFIVGPHNHKGGRGRRVSRQKTAISEKGRTRHGENGPTRCGPGKSHTLVPRSSFPFPNEVLRSSLLRKMSAKHGNHERPGVPGAPKTHEKGKDKKIDGRKINSYAIGSEVHENDVSSNEG